MTTYTTDELGKAYNAYMAYNFKAKTERLREFDLKRWLKVVRAMNGQSLNGKSKRKWSAAQRAKFKATWKAARAHNAASK